MWLVILIKLSILFLVFKLFFFKDALQDYKTPQDKANYVIEHLTKTR